MRKLAILTAFALLMGAAPMAFAEPPSNDNLSDAAGVALPFSDSKDTSEATTELGEPVTNCEIRPTQNTIWYKFTAATSDRLFIDTLGSNFDTVVAIYVDYDYPLSLTEFDDLAPMGCEDPGIEDEFSLWVYEGYTYYFQVGGHIDRPSGTAAFNVKAGGSISGTVTDGSGAGIRDICVNALKEYDWYGYTYYGSALTDAQGSYKILGLPTDSFLVTFWDCSYDGTDFESEVYNDKELLKDGDPVTVNVGEDTPDIDATLAAYVPPPPPPPVYTDLAVSELKVTNVPVRTDHGDVGNTGFVRQIDAEVSNLSTSDSPAFLNVRACEAGGDCRTIHRAYLDSKAGSKVTQSFRWDALGWFGDVSIQAEVCTGHFNVVDTDGSNNKRSVDHYVMVGGIGRGYHLLDPGRYAFDDYYGDPCGGAYVTPYPPSPPGL